MKRAEYQFTIPIDGSLRTTVPPFQAVSMEIVNGTTQTLTVSDDRGVIASVPSGGLYCIPLRSSLSYTFQLAASSTGAAWAFLYNYRKPIVAFAPSSGGGGVGTTVKVQDAGGVNLLAIDGTGKIGINALPNVTIGALPNVVIASSPNPTGANHVAALANTAITGAGVSVAIARATRTQLQLRARTANTDIITIACDAGTFILHPGDVLGLTCVLAVTATAGSGTQNLDGWDEYM